MNEYLQQFREQYPDYADMGDLELAKALHSKFYSDMSFGDFAEKIKLNSGPTQEPPFASLPPLAGGILDALVAFGNGAGLGLPAKLSKDTGAYRAELMDRAQGPTLAAEGAGAATTALLGTKGFQAAKAEMNAPGRWLQSRMFGSTRPFPGTAPASPGVGSMAINMLKNQYFRGGLGAIAAEEAIRRLARSVR